MNKIWSDYKIWLIKMCRINRIGYNHLIDQLHNSPFEAVLERDNNRINDGLDLRHRFLIENGINGDFFDHPAGILEVLIALAVRIDSEFLGNPMDPHPDIMFWEMICNLGLDKFDDKHYNSDEIYRILGIWINREYDFYGNGGVFPIPKTHKNVQNQREIELWMQMTAYINVNFM